MGSLEFLHAAAISCAAYWYFNGLPRMQPGWLAARACHRPGRMAFLASVRFIIFAIVALSGVRFAAGQEQERRIEERLLKPNLNLRFDLRQNSTFGRQSFETSNARVKDFYFTQRFAPKQYETTAWRGGKKPWYGDFKFSTGEAATKGKYEIPNAAKQADTKTLPVKDAKESDKEMPTGKYAKHDRSYLGKEAERMNRKLPAGTPTESTSELRPLTIDEVRELLNKSK